MKKVLIVNDRKKPFGLSWTHAVAFGVGAAFGILTGILIGTAKKCGRDAAKYYGALAESLNDLSDTDVEDADDLPDLDEADEIIANLSDEAPTAEESDAESDCADTGCCGCESEE